MEGLQQIAKKFINTTRSHLFLTGKAGTGKTTFLKSLGSITRKNFIVVAPTGIAALNAGGVTIHSQFLFPFGIFIPDRFAPDDLSESQPFYTQDTLARKHPLNSSRRQVLRSIDLLVIDEVSMMRADLLDAIDYRLRSVRGNFQESFGGVQVLFIGDLFQLPPVVRRDDEAILNRFYKSPWFYEAKAIEKNPPILIELDKIYRQNDGGFIDLLNNLRNNLITASDIELLNRHYRTQDQIKELREVVTLTTHNYKAEEINRRELEILPGKSYFFDALVEGEFPESMFPLSLRMELKVGAQVMFVRNDSEGQYFNGKLATVRDIQGNDIWVEMAGTHIRYKLKRENWSNKKYTMNANRDLEEEEVGTFGQFPVKLAWAITVHKSQGLTFEKAIIDVAEAFADGQVYVALSRLRSLDGLVLRTKINSSVISTDKNVMTFVARNHQPAQLDALMKSGQMEFVRAMLAKTFEFSPVVKEIRHVLKANTESIVKVQAEAVLGSIAGSFEAERSNTEKFGAQLQTLLAADAPKLRERLQKGSAYYRNFLNDKLKTLLLHVEEMRRQKRVKTYVNQLEELDVLITNKLREVDGSMYLLRILEGDDSLPDDSGSGKRAQERESMLNQIREQLPAAKERKKKKKGKKKNSGEPSTYEITISLLSQGMSVKEIAVHRGLAASTIESHLAKAVESGKILISDFVSQDILQEVSAAIGSMPEDFSLMSLYHHLKGKYGHGLLRAVVAHQQLAK